MSQKILTPTTPLWARIILVILAFIFVGGAFQIIGYFFAGIPVENLGVDIEMTLLQTVTIQFWNFIGVFLVIYSFRVILDRKPFITIGLSLKNRFLDFIGGFLIAFAIFGIGYLFLYSQNYIRITDVFFNLRSLSLSFLLFFIVSVTEEFLVRGYILNNLMDSMNKYIALILSSILFAILHVINPNLNLIGITNLFLAGLTLGAAYIYTRNLWFPISLHLFWNFIQGPILGFNVSGKKLDSLFVLNINGSEIINGGDFGFEGSILCTILELISFIGLLYYFRRKETLLQKEVIID